MYNLVAYIGQKTEAINLWKDCVIYAIGIDLPPQGKILA